MIAVSAFAVFTVITVTGEAIVALTLLFNQVWMLQKVLYFHLVPDHRKDMIVIMSDFRAAIAVFNISAYSFSVAAFF